MFAFFYFVRRFCFYGSAFFFCSCVAGCRFSAGAPESIWRALFVYDVAFLDLCGPQVSEVNVLSSDNAARVRLYFQFMQSLGSIRSPSITTFGSVGANTYQIGCLARNGKIYAMPDNATQVLEIDPDTRTVSNVPGTVAGANPKYSGCALQANNGKIWGAARNPTQILEVDPTTRTTFQDIAGTLPFASFLGAKTGPDGHIYAFRDSAGAVLDYNPNTRTSTSFAAIPGYGEAVLATNGKFYGVPNNTNPPVGEIDPIARSLRTGGGTYGAGAYDGGSIAPNGKIYMTPLAATTVLEVDPDLFPASNAFSQFGSTFGNQYSNGILAPNGKIYAPPRTGTSVLVTDPLNRTTSTIGTTSGVYIGATMGLNGKIYFIPNGATTIAELDTGSAGTFCPNVILSSYVNSN